MDQYPYSIPPSYQFAENSTDKNSDVAGEPGLSNQNSFFMNTGATGAPFGFVPPQQEQQQHILPQTPGQANGLIPQLQPGAPVGYEAYGNQQFPGQVPPSADSIASIQSTISPPPLATNIGMEEIYNAQNYIRDANINASSMDFPAAEVVPPLQVEPQVSLIESVEQQHSQTFTASALDVVPSVPALLKVPYVPAAIESQPTEPTQISAEVSAPIETSTTPDSSATSSNLQRDIDNSQTVPITNSATVDNETTPVAVSEYDTSTPTSDCPPISTDAVVPTQAEHSEDAHMEIVAKSPTDVLGVSPTAKLDEPAEDTTPPTAKKKRRRIMLMNDGDDSDEDDGCDRFELLRSPEPPATEGDLATPGIVESTAGNEKPNDGSEGSENEDGERPFSPDSGKGVTSIFQNVVMIPAGDMEAHKRKKIRVLDSDDEDDQQVADSVDDIGLTGEGAGDEVNPAGLLMDENAEDGDYGTTEGIDMDKMEQIVAMDAPIIDPSRMINEDEDEGGSESGDKDKEESDNDQGSQNSDAEDQEEEELGEEEEIVEEGVEMIAAENEAGEAIGIATDDENELEEDGQPEESVVDEEEEYGDRGSDQEEQVSEAEESGDERESDSDKEEGANQNENDQSESRSTSSPANQEKESQESTSDRRKEDDASKSGSEDDVVCQNDLELNTISLLTDEEDDNPTPLPPPKKELPVVRIVNIKKELLDDRIVKREPRLDTASSYQQQHYLKQQQQIAQRKQEKKKKKERVFDNNDPFGAWKSSSSDDEFIPNDIYFGTPDRVFTASTKIRCQRQKIINERYTKYGKPGKSGKRRYSDDSDAEERRKRKEKLDQVARLNLPSYQQQQLQNLIKKKKKRKHDRFYDKSQDIPNDIYFGNVNVPLHILYAFGSSSSDDERVDRNRPAAAWKPLPASASKTGKYQPSSSKTVRSSSSSSFSRSTLSPSNDRSVQAMKEYLKIAGFKNVKFHKLWEGCKSNQERANAILRLMQEKGLEGEPTIAKCRELRKQLQMEREAKVLDTSLIIDSGEGRITRRSTRIPQNHGFSDGSDLNAPSTSGMCQATVVPPESLETLNRIRNVIDPDSDGE